MKQIGILLALLALIISIAAIVLINGCSSEPTTPRTIPDTEPETLPQTPPRVAEIAPPPQIIVGVNRNQFFEAFPNGDLEQLTLRAVDFGITFYSDDAYAPKWTGQGLSFDDPDRIVPQLLAHHYAGDLWFWFPINTHSTDKLQATYNYWKAKGWFDDATWFFFITGFSDEVRTTEEITQNNTMYTQYKALYPEIKWMITREITQYDPEKPTALGDAFLPMFHMYEMEKKYLELTGGSIEEAYANVTMGGYISGDTDDPPSMEPDWYLTNWPKYFPGQAPNVPVLTTQEAGSIVGYCDTEGMKFFLWWDILGLLDDVNGNPLPRDITFHLLGY